MAVVRLTPTRLDLEVYAGDANLLEVEVWAGDALLDLTGAAITAQARKSPTDPVVACQATVVIIDPVAGLLSLAWDGEVIRNILGGLKTWRGVWDMQILLPGSVYPTTPSGGQWTARMDVTKVGN